MRNRIWLCLVFSLVRGMDSSKAQGQWQSLAGGTSDQVRSFCILPGEEHLLVGGNFPWLNVDTLRVNNIAAWNGTAWSTEHTGGGNGSTFTNGNTNPVLSMVSWNDTLYCGFLDVDWHGNPDIDWGAYLTDDTVWHAVPGRPNGPLLFAAVNGHLFMGGNANELDSLPFPGVCEVIGGQPQPLLNNPMDGADIWAFEHWHDSYYFGGHISSEYVGSRNIIAFDGFGQWAALVEGIGGNHIRSIRGYGDSLYVGGYFLPGNNVQSTHIQIWDGVSWHAFFPQVEFVSQVFDMEVYQGALYICGNFQFVADGPVYAILRYDGHQLCAIGGPCPSGDNIAMAFFQNDLYMATGSTFPGLIHEWIARLPLEGLVPDECVEVLTGEQEYGDEGQGISVYPNPATDHVTVCSDTTGHPLSIIIRDASGRQVTTASAMANGQTDVDIRSLAPGCYCVAVTDTDGRRTGRFVKR